MHRQPFAWSAFTVFGHVRNRVTRPWCMKTSEEVLAGLKASVGHLRIPHGKVWAVPDNSGKSCIQKRRLVFHRNLNVVEHFTSCSRVIGLQR